MQLIGRVAKKILVSYFRRLPAPPSAKRVLDREHDKIIIVTQSRSLLVESLLEALLSRNKRIAVYYRGSSVTDSLAYVSIHDATTIDALSRLDGEQTLITFSLFKGRGPVRSLPSYRLKVSDYIFLFIGPMFRARVLVCVFGEPFELSTFRGTSGRNLARYLKVDFYRNLKMVRGTPFQSYQIQERTILSGNEYEREIDAVARRLRVSRAKVHRRAKRALRMMAARPFAPLYIPAALIARFILRRLFHEVRVEGLEQFAENVRRHTVILVPLHRSHIDYIILSSALYDSNLNPPVIAAGVNLSFWPFGGIIRALGGYFVKRNNRDDRLHNLLLKRYVSYLVKRGHLQEFFIEGGRSRSGRMRAPKMGLLSIIVSAFEQGARKDILFVPVSLTYEHVVEDREYGRENTGQEKTRESLASLLRAVGIFRNRYKEVLVRFGAPVHLEEFLQRRPDKRVGESRQVVNELALELTKRIQEQMAVSLRALSCTALLTSPNYGLPEHVFHRRIKELAFMAKVAFASRGCDLQRYCTPSLSHYLAQSDDAGSSEVTIDGILKTRELFGQQLIFVPGKTRFTAEFYRNSTAHIFLPWGILSLLSVLGQDFSEMNIAVLHTRLERDYLLEPFELFHHQFQQFLEHLVNHALLEKGQRNIFALTPSGGSLVLPALLLPVLESHLWILCQLSHSETIEGTGKFLALAQREYEVAKYIGVFDRTEAGALSSLSTALDSLLSRKLVVDRQEAGLPRRFEVTAAGKVEAQKLFEIIETITHWEIRQRGRLLYELGILNLDE